MQIYCQHFKLIYVLISFEQQYIKLNTFIYTLSVNEGVKALSADELLSKMFHEHLFYIACAR